jgi:hypothetical protein
MIKFVMNRCFMQSYQSLIIKGVTNNIQLNGKCTVCLSSFFITYYKTLLLMSDGAVPVENDDYCSWQGNAREGPCLRID